MLKSIIGLVLAGSLAAVPAHSAEVLLATHNPSNTKVYAEAKDGRLHLKSIGPTYMTVSYNIDANANGTVEPEIDVAYGFHDNGMLCPQKWLTEASWSFCGKLVSAARASQEVIGDLRIRRLDVPIAEIARNGKTFAFKIDFWNNQAKSRSHGSGLFTLATGAITAAPVSQARVAAQRLAPAAPAANGLAPLGREYQVTAAMVRQDIQDFFRNYLYDLRLRGKAGDRFRIAWRSTVPVNLDYDHDRGYETDYPKGAKITDLSTSVTITLTRGGDHVLTFDQIGVSFPDRKPTSSLAIPSFEGKMNRPFQPITMSVQKLN